MKTKWPPRPETVLSDLASLSTIVYPAMDAAADHAVQYFERNGFSTIDPWLHSHIVRHSAKPHLLADEVIELGYRVVDQPFSGLLLASNKYQVRILKTYHRLDFLTGKVEMTIQGPGSSRARRDYFEQPMFEWDDETHPLKRLRVPQVLRLVMLWDINPACQLIGLDLVCPRTADLTANHVATHWWVPIPDPRAAMPILREPEFEKQLLLEDIEFPNDEQDFAAGNNNDLR